MSSPHPRFAAPDGSQNRQKHFGRIMSIQNFTRRMTRWRVPISTTGHCPAKGSWAQTMQTKTRMQGMETISIVRARGPGRFQGLGRNT